MEEKILTGLEQKQKRVIDLMEENRILDGKLQELKKDDKVKGE